MESEIEPTVAAVDSILCQCGDADVISVLLNGSRSVELREKFSGAGPIRYYESDQNLGVAGGRNFLLRTDEATRAQFILFVDNDALVPQDYLDRSCGLLAKDPSIGVAGCIVLQYPIALGLLLSEYPTFGGYFETKQHSVFSDQIREGLVRLPSLHSVLYHAGTNADWNRAYFDDVNVLDLILCNRALIPDRTFFISNAADMPFVNELLSGGVIRNVANVPGCCQAFRRSLVDEIGYLNDIFNPYGFEDVDFCYRAMAAGYRNVVGAHTVMFHGTDSRHDDRTTPIARAQKAGNDFRAWTLFAFLHDQDRFPRNVLSNLIARFLFWEHSGPGHQYEVLHYLWRGLKHALKQIAEAYPDRFKNAIERCDIHHPIQDMLRSTLEVSQGTIDRQQAIRESAERRFSRYARESVADSATTNANIQSVAGGLRHAMARRGSGSIERFRDLHAGERCFIIGNGPSLKRADLNALAREVTFGVNGIFYMTDDIGFRPTYYVVEDNHVIYDNVNRINRLDAQGKFFPNKYRDIVHETDSTYFLNTDWLFYSKASPFFEMPRFSSDCAKEIFVGQTVTYLNLQLAYYMGFTEVYLLGMDFSYLIPPSSLIQGFTIESAEDDPNHFHPAYFGRGKKWHFPKLHNCIAVYEHAKSEYDAAGRLVVNATDGGKLEVFPRVPLKDVLDDSSTVAAPNERLISIFRVVLREVSRHTPRPRIIMPRLALNGPDWESLLDQLRGAFDLAEVDHSTDLHLAGGGDLAICVASERRVDWDLIARSASTVVLQVWGAERAAQDVGDSAIRLAGAAWILGDVIVLRPPGEQLPLTGWADSLARNRIQSTPPANRSHLRYVIENRIGLGSWVWTPLSRDPSGQLDQASHKLVALFLDMNIPVTVDGLAIFARL